MLSIHKLQHLAAKWDIIFAHRPSTFRNSFIFWFFRVVFNIIILLALILLVTTFSREMWLPALEDVVTQEDYEIMDGILLGLRVIAIFFIIISGIIVWLSRSAIRRNNYIDQVEALLNEYKEVSAKEYSANPNNYSPKP